MFVFLKLTNIIEPGFFRTDPKEVVAVAVSGAGAGAVVVVVVVVVGHVTAQLLLI